MAAWRERENIIINTHTHTHTHTHVPGSARSGMENNPGLRGHPLGICQTEVLAQWSRDQPGKETLMILRKRRHSPASQLLCSAEQLTRLLCYHVSSTTSAVPSEPPASCLLIFQVHQCFHPGVAWKAKELKPNASALLRMRAHHLCWLLL